MFKTSVCTIELKSNIVVVRRQICSKGDFYCNVSFNDVFVITEIFFFFIVIFFSEIQQKKNEGNIDK